MRSVSVEPHTVHAHTDHSAGGSDGLGLALGFGIPAFVFAILGVVFVLVRRFVRRQMKEARARANHEGIVLESAPVWMTVQYESYRSPRLYVGYGVRKMRVTMILTRERLAFIPGTHLSVGRGDLGRFHVGLGEEGALRIHTKDPPGARGSMEYSVPVPDAANWVAALTAAGAHKG
jgi:hypothetical protein